MNDFRIITIGRGKATHAAFGISLCGAEGRRGMIDQGTEADGPVTCKRCVKSLASLVERDHAEAKTENEQRSTPAPAEVHAFGRDIYAAASATACGTTGIRCGDDSQLTCEECREIVAKRAKTIEQAEAEIAALDGRPGTPHPYKAISGVQGCAEGLADAPRCCGRPDSDALHLEATRDRSVEEGHNVHGTPGYVTPPVVVKAKPVKLSEPMRDALRQALRRGGLLSEYDLPTNTSVALIDRWLMTPLHWCAVGEDWHGRMHQLTDEGIAVAETLLDRPWLAPIIEQAWRDLANLAICPGCSWRRVASDPAEAEYHVQGHVNQEHLPLTYTVDDRRTYGRFLSDKRIGQVNAWLAQHRPMSREDLRAWLALRGVRDESQMALFLAEYAGKTETEMDNLYSELHGSTA